MTRSSAVENIRLFNRFYTNLIGVVDTHILESPYSLTEARILLEIHTNPECHARKLLNTLNIDEGYLSRTIDKLSSRGLIIKSKSPRDQRIKLLSLSKKGNTEFQKLNHRSHAAIETIIEHLSDNEISELVGHVRQIQELLSRSGEK